MITLIVPIQSSKHRIEFVGGKIPSFRRVDGEWVFFIPSGLDLPIDVQFSPVTRPEIIVKSGSVSGFVLFSVFILIFIVFGGGKNGKSTT